MLSAAKLYLSPHFSKTFRLISTSPATNNTKPNDPPAHSVDVHSKFTGDIIGPPHPTSNIPQTRFAVGRKTQSQAEREYRELRQYVHEFNNNFWQRHNELFQNERRKFIDDYAEKNDGRRDLSAEDLSVFYQRFLNEQYRKNLEYNWKWYRLNFELLKAEAKFLFHRLFAGRKR